MKNILTQSTSILMATASVATYRPFNWRVVILLYPTGYLIGWREVHSGYLMAHFFACPTPGDDGSDGGVIEPKRRKSRDDYFDGTKNQDDKYIPKNDDKKPRKPRD